MPKLQNRASNISLDANLLKPCEKHETAFRSNSFIFEGKNPLNRVRDANIHFVPGGSLYSACWTQLDHFMVFSKVFSLDNLPARKKVKILQWVRLHRWHEFQYNCQKTLEKSVGSIHAALRFRSASECREIIV